MKRATTILLSALALTPAAPLAPTAVASRAPTATERAALAQALTAPRRCLEIRVSTVRRGWASVSFRSPVRDSCLRYVADGVSVHRRRDDIWREVFVGSSWSCPIPRVPEDVRRDLRLPCPEGGP
jgi:hypothetical protein